MRGIGPLCDHRIVVYRATIVRDELNDSVQTWGALPAGPGKNARPNQAWAGNQVDPGPGLVEGAMRQWYLLPSVQVRTGDVLKVVTGPEAGAELLVEAITKPTGLRGVVHHLEANVRPYTGSLT